MTWRGGIVVVAVALVACSGPGAASTTTFVAGPAARLPGETQTQAWNRVHDDCLEAAGIDFELIGAEIDGVPTTVRGFYDTPEYPAAEQRCKGVATDAVGDPNRPPTHDDYLRVVAFVDCLSERGLDMGVVVSEEEYLASDGDADFSSQWSQASEGDPAAFSDAYDSCLSTLTDAAGG